MKPLPLALLGLAAAFFTLSTVAQSLPTVASTDLSPAYSTSTLPSAPEPSPAPPQDLVASTPTSITPHHATDISVGGLGNFILSRNPGYTSNQTAPPTSEARSQSAAPTGGALVTFHQQFRPWLGYNISASYSSTSFTYTEGASASGYMRFSRGSIGTSMVELSSAWVIQGPRSGRLSTFADLGAGFLTFVPSNKTLPDSYVFRPTGVGGVGVNYRLSPHLALRAEYRGLYFKGPDFRYTGGIIPVTTRYTLSSQTALSLTYLFGPTSHIHATHTSPQPSSKSGVETSIFLGAFPQLSATRISSSGNGGVLTQSTTPSAGVLGGFHQQFHSWLGYSVNLGYTRDTTRYTGVAGSGSNGISARNGVYELSLSYVAQKHLTPRLTGFTEAGAGMLAYLRMNRENGPGSDYRPLGIAGVGLDYHLSGGLSLRAEYRGQFYKYANYGISIPHVFTLSSEPTIGLSYTFGKPKH